MSQRLIKPGIRAVEGISGVKTAGAIIGYYADGRPIYLMGGGAPDPAGGDDTPPAGLGDDDNSSDEGDDEEDDEDESDDDDDSSKDDKGKSNKSKKSSDDDEDDEDKPVYTVAEYQKIKARMKAADAHASKAQKELAEYKAGMRKNDSAAAELAELQKKYNDLEPQVQQMRLETAFFKASDVDWVSPADALKLADLSDVDTDDDGKVDVKALRAALRRLAKDKPYLVKSNDKGGKGKKDDDADAGSSSGTNGRSASKMNTRRKGNQPPSRAQLSKRYPVLNT